MYKKLTEIKGVGPNLYKVLVTNEIYNPYQLILNIPKSYDNFLLYEELNQRNHNEVVTVKGLVSSEIIVNQYSKRKLAIFTIEVADQVIECIAFNQSYLEKSIEKNQTYLINGKYNFYRNQLVVSKVIKEAAFNKIVPKYNIKGIYDSTYQKIVKTILDENLANIYETMPLDLIAKYGLIDRKKMFYNLHLPTDKKAIEIAIKRLKYEEAYIFQKEFAKKVNVPIKRPAINYKLTEVKTLIENLEFELTNDQKNVVNDIFKDYKKTHNTFRLIQGDVGSGKTVVALIAILGILTSGKQAAFMAPTTILATQQYEYFKKYLSNYHVELLTSNTKDKSKIKEKIAAGQIDLIVGTHAIALEDVNYHDLGLVIIDEQHKFGVNIRKEIASKGNANLIYLTATPIPRTLAITFYGEAQTSSIKEKPKNRVPIITKYINDEKIAEVIALIKQNNNRNLQTFIVVPAIESSHVKYNINNVYKILESNNLADETLVLHGKLKDDEKDLAINDFYDGKKKILLATSMVEVGIDIKKATLMIIFSADNFGLSQLHQLRGRIGRSNLESLCILIGSGEEKERLELLTKVNDGFVLSEFDLKLRGPGALIGMEQSGNLNFKYLDFLKDFEILKTMHDEIIKKL